MECHYKIGMSDIFCAVADVDFNFHLASCVIYITYKPTPELLRVPDKREMIDFGNGFFGQRRFFCNGRVSKIR